MLTAPLIAQHIDSVAVLGPKFIPFFFRLHSVQRHQIVTALLLIHKIRAVNMGINRHIANMSG